MLPDPSGISLFSEIQGDVGNAPRIPRRLLAVKYQLSKSSGICQGLKGRMDNGLGIRYTNFHPDLNCTARVGDPDRPGWPSLQHRFDELDSR